MPNQEFENWIDGATGNYLFPKAKPKEIADIAKNTTIETFHLNDLKEREHSYPWSERIKKGFLRLYDQVDAERKESGIVVSGGNSKIVSESPR
jgi:hypothetical protein